MIPPLIFSLLAFFVVITTTVVVIKNKSKVSNINKNFNTTKQKIESDKHTNEKKLQNLVHEINFNNKKLENSHNNTKNELKLENKKTNEKMNNLDKRFNSYKNITTANLMGINNRMTSENERLQQEIDLNKELINQNRRDHRAGINSNAAEIFNTNNRMTRFINNDYNPTIANINSSHLSAVADIASLRSNITNSVIDSSNMNLDARILIRDDVRGRYNRTNDSLTNFFNFDGNFIENNYTYSSNNTLFRDWYDNYYNVASYSNFKKMDELLLAADQDMNELRVERQRIDTLEGRATNIESSLHPDSNLYKNDLASFINSEYNFQLENLRNIQDNTQDINNLSEKVQGLSNVLKQITLVDATESVISLDALNSNIQENSRKINLNENAIDEKFNRNFGTYFGSYLGSNYQTITDNLDETVLKNKIANKNHTFNYLTASNIISNSLESENDLIFGGDLKFNNTSYKTKIDNNENYTKTLDQVFGYDNTFRQHDNISDEITSDPMIRFVKPIIPESISSQDLNLDKTVDIQPGINISMKKDGGEGGKLFIDDWNDIGLNKYVSILGGSVINNDVIANKSVARETLGDKFNNIDDQLAAMSNDISGFTAQQQNGILKNQLYNVLNQSGTSSTYGTDGRGEFGDQYKNSMRVKHLYTGALDPDYRCTMDDGEIKTDAKSQCLTIDNRLKALEAEQTSAFGESLAYNLDQTYNITLDSTSSSLNINKEINAKNNVNITSSLSVGGNTTLNGNLYVGKNSSKVILDSIDDVEIQINEDGTTKELQTYFVKTNDRYIETITALGPSGSPPTGFEYKNSTDDSPTTINFPETSSNITVSTGDVKTFTKNTGARLATDGDISRFSFSTHDASPVTTFDVPNEYVYSITDNEGTFTVTQKPLNGDLNNDLIISKGVTNKTDILNELATTATNDIKPAFQGIHLGGKCLKVDDNKLKLCATGCSAPCATIWDTNTAPDPNNTL